MTKANKPIEINVDDELIKSLDIKSNSLVVITTPHPLDSVSAEYYYSTLKGIIYHATGITPNLCLIDYGGNLEIMPDDRLIGIKTQINRILKDRAN